MKTTQINICLIAPFPPPYGGISNWSTLIMEHAARRPDVNFMVLDIAPRWRSSYNTKIFLRVIGGTFQLLRDTFNLIRILAKHRFDIIHLTTSGQLAVMRDLVTSYLVKIYGVKLVYHIHMGRIPMISKANSLEWRLILHVMRRASMVVVIDNLTFTTIKHVAPDVNVVLIPNCLNITALPIPIVTPVKVKTALFVGWVIPTKGITELVEAWAMLRQEGWQLKIVGPGDLTYQNSLLQQFEPKNLEFVGELSHAHAISSMANCDLFILPSHTEGFPYVVLEAMALGCPIVATEVGAIPEMLEGDAGVIVKTKDVQALAEALSCVMQDSEMRERIGKKALNKAKHLYTIDVVFSTYMQIWKSTSNFDKNL